MKKLFGLFVIGILSSTAMAELVCLSPSGCAIELETGACPTCVENLIVESIVEPVVETIVVIQSSKTTKSIQLPNEEWLDVPIYFYDETPNKCPNYFERDHDSCEFGANGCLRGTKSDAHWSCHSNYKRCKKNEASHNEGRTKNNGKMRC